MSRERDFEIHISFFLPKPGKIHSGLSQMPLVPGDERHERSVHVRQRRHRVSMFSERQIVY